MFVLQKNKSFFSFSGTLVFPLSWEVFWGAERPKTPPFSKYKPTKFQKIEKNLLCSVIKHIFPNFHASYLISQPKVWETFALFTSFTKSERKLEIISDKNELFGFCGNFEPFKFCKINYDFEPSKWKVFLGVVEI